MPSVDASMTRSSAAKSSVCGSLRAVTEAVLAVERRKMDHGHVISATVAPAHYTHVEPVDVTATVAHIVDDDWLFDNDEEGDKGRVAEKVRRVVFRRVSRLSSGLRLCVC